MINRPTAFPGTTSTRHRGVLLTVVALLVALFTASPAAAAPAAAGQGWARFGHFAPAAGAVDVQLDGQPFASGITFKSVSEYQAVSEGVHQFDVRPSGDPTGPALLSIDVSVPDQGAITVAAVTSRDGVSPQVFDDALIRPAADRSLVRFVQAAPDAAAIDVALRDGTQLATGVPYPGSTDYQDIAPGQYDVVVTDSQSGAVVLEVAGWSIEPGVQSTIVFVRGTDGALDVAPVIDTASVAAAPVGGVQTGFGGMADVLDPRPTSPKTDLVLVTIALTVALAGAWWAFAARARSGPLAGPA